MKRENERQEEESLRKSKRVSARIKRISNGGECLGMVMKSDNERVQEEQEKESAWERRRQAGLWVWGRRWSICIKGRAECPAVERVGTAPHRLAEGADRREKNSRAGEWQRSSEEEEGDLVNSTSLVLREEGPAALALAMGKSLVCVLDCPFISLIAEHSAFGKCPVCVNLRGPTV